MAIDVDLLKAIPYFAGLEEADLEAVKQYMFEQSVERNDMILIEGDPAEAVYFVVSGAVKVFKTSIEGKRTDLCLVRAGESFNDVPVLDGGPNIASAIAMTPVVVYGMTKSGTRERAKRYFAPSQVSRRSATRPSSRENSPCVPSSPKRRTISSADNPSTIRRKRSMASSAAFSFAPSSSASSTTPAGSRRYASRSARFFQRRPPEMRGCRGAEAKVLTTTPVVEVMPALPARQAEVRDFVVDETPPPQHGLRLPKEICLIVVGRQIVRQVCRQRSPMLQ